MIQKTSYLKIVDNSSALKVLLLRAWRRPGFSRKKPFLRVGDFFVGVVKKRRSFRDSKIVYGVILQTKKASENLATGVYSKNDLNSAILLNSDCRPIGTRCFVPVPRFFGQMNFKKSYRRQFIRLLTLRYLSYNG